MPRSEDSIPEGQRIALREPLRVHLHSLPTDAEEMADLIRETAERAMRIAGIQQVYPGPGGMGMQGGGYMDHFQRGQAQAQAGMGNPQAAPYTWYGAGFTESPFSSRDVVPWYPPPRPPIPIWSVLRKLFKL